MKKYIIILSALFCLFSCVNEEGEGGTGVIEGYVYKVMHPDEIVYTEDGGYKLKIDTFPAAEYRVFIKYGLGGELNVDDNRRLGPSGYFKFEFLSKGNYVIFSNSEYPNGYPEAVLDTVYVKKGKTVKTNAIYIHEGKMFGNACIKGTLLANYYDKNVLVTTNGAVPAAEQRVYIRKKGAGFPFDDVRAGADGTFIFEKLPMGEYQIYAVSENSDRIIYVDDENIIDEKITEIGSIKELEKPIIVKLRS